MPPKYGKSPYGPAASFQGRSAAASGLADPAFRLISAWIRKGENREPPCAPVLDALAVQEYLYAQEVVMQSFYTAKCTPIDSGYMGQIVEWPEVVTEGSTLEECRAMLGDALREMVAAYADLKKELPLNKAFFEQILVEV